MDAEQLRRLRLAYPFKPFTLHMEDGRQFLIDQPPYLAISPTGKIILVATGGENVEMFKPEWVKDAIMVDGASASTSEDPPARESA
jgi:hypothetical protein